MAKKKRVLLTGANGRLGRLLTTSLGDKYDFVLVDLIMKKGQGYQADIGDEKKILNVFKKVKPIEVVVHLAAASRPECSWEEILKSNIIGVHNLYNAIKKTKIKKVVFISTNRVTGAYEGFPKTLHKIRKPKKIKPNDPIAVDCEYGASKVFGEAIARLYSDRDGIDSICLRLGSVLENDKPKSARRKKTWLSHRDFVQLIDKSIETKKKFGIYYGLSNNKGRFYNISATKKDLGFRPQDNSSKL